MEQGLNGMQQSGRSEGQAQILEALLGTQDLDRYSCFQSIIKCRAD